MAAQIDQIQLDYSLGHKFAHDPWPGMLVKTDLNSALEAVCAVMNDELKAAFDTVFGTDENNWKEIDLFPACRMIGGRATLRFTLGDSTKGKELCKPKVRCLRVESILICTIRSRRGVRTELL